MNFKHTLELDWVWGYPAAIGLMIVVAAGILLWFRRRGWIGGDKACVLLPSSADLTWREPALESDNKFDCRFDCAGIEAIGAHRDCGSR